MNKPVSDSRSFEVLTASPVRLSSSPARSYRSWSDEEKARIVGHFEYLKELLSQGRLILAGMALDDYAGIVIIRAEDRLDAERIMTGDPAVGGNVFLAERHPYTVTLMTGGK